MRRRAIKSSVGRMVTPRVDIGVLEGLHRFKITKPVNVPLLRLTVKLGSAAKVYFAQGVDAEAAPG